MVLVRMGSPWCLVRVSNVSIGDWYSQNVSATKYCVLADGVYLAGGIIDGNVYVCSYGDRPFVQI